MAVRTATIFQKGANSARGESAQSVKLRYLILTPVDPGQIFRMIACQLDPFGKKLGPGREAWPPPPATDQAAAPRAYIGNLLAFTALLTSAEIQPLWPYGGTLAHQPRRSPTFRINRWARCAEGETSARPRHPVLPSPPLATIPTLFELSWGLTKAGGHDRANRSRGEVGFTWTVAQVPGGTRNELATQTKSGLYSTDTGTLRTYVKIKSPSSSPSSGRFTPLKHATESKREQIVVRFILLTILDMLFIGGGCPMTWHQN